MRSDDSLVARPRRRFWRGMEVAAVLLAALIGSQVPVLIDRYQETLAGRAASAREDVAAIVDRARAEQMAVHELLDDAQGQAAAHMTAQLRAQIDQAGTLDTARLRLANADLIERPVVMLAHFDQEVAADAWTGFSPAVSKPGPSLVFAGLGAGLAGAIIVGLRLARRRRTAGELS